MKAADGGTTREEMRSAREHVKASLAWPKPCRTGGAETAAAWLRVANTNAGKRRLLLKAIAEWIRWRAERGVPADWRHRAASDGMRGGLGRMTSAELRAAAGISGVRKR